MYTSYKKISLSSFGHSEQQTDQEKIKQYTEKCKAVSLAVSAVRQWCDHQKVSLPTEILSLTQSAMGMIEQTLNNVSINVQIFDKTPTNAALDVIHSHFKKMRTGIANLRSTLAQHYAHVSKTKPLDDYLNLVSTALKIQEMPLTRAIHWQELVMVVEQDILHGNVTDQEECARLQEAIAPQQLNDGISRHIASEFNTLKAQIRVLSKRPQHPNFSCFVMYAWPHASKPHEQWTQPFLMRLVEDLNGMGIQTEIDQKDSTHGRSMPEFRQGINAKNYVLVVGTESLRYKYLHQFNSTVRKELQIVVERAADAHRSMNQIMTRYPPVIPLLISGTVNSTFPENFPSYLAITPWAMSDKTTPRPCSYYQGLKALVTHMCHAESDPEFNAAWSAFEKAMQQEGNNWLIEGLSQQHCSSFVRGKQPQSNPINLTVAKPNQAQSKAPPPASSTTLPPQNTDHRELQAALQQHGIRITQPPHQTRAATTRDCGTDTLCQLAIELAESILEKATQQYLVRRRLGSNNEIPRTPDGTPIVTFRSGVFSTTEYQPTRSTLIAFIVQGFAAADLGNNTHQLKDVFKESIIDTLVKDCFCYDTWDAGGGFFGKPWSTGAVGLTKKFRADFVIETVKTSAAAPATLSSTPSPSP